MKRSIILLGATLFLGGCDMGSTADGPRAGGEDFPNTVQALGRTLALGLDSSSGWNSLDSADVAVSGDGALADTARLLAGRSAGLACFDTGYGGLAGSLDRYYYTKTKCLAIGFVRDSIVVAELGNSSGGKDTVVYHMMVDSVLLRYRVLTTVLDADGDGRFLLRNDPGKVILAVRKTAGRWTLSSRMLMDAGPDGLYDPGEDNRIYSGSRTLVMNVDTVRHETFDPYAAGRPILAARGDSGLVWVSKLSKGAFRTRTERGLIMAFRDTLRNYPAYWKAHTSWAGGGLRDEMVFGARADSMFWGGDTVTFLDRSKVGLDSLRVQVRAILSANASDRSHDSLLSIRAERLRTSKFERHSVWEFESDKPLASGKDAESGKLLARVDFADGRWIQFRGHWTLGTFTGTYTTDSDSADIVVNRDGSVKSVTKK